MPDTLLKLLVKDKPLTAEKYPKKGKLNFLGERNEVRALAAENPEERH